MLHHYLRPLVTPASVALVGASERPGSIGRIVLENILGSTFQGEFHAINPNHRKVLGRKCLRLQLSRRAIAVCRKIHWQRIYRGL